MKKHPHLQIIKLDNGKFKGFIYGEWSYELKSENACHKWAFNFDKWLDYQSATLRQQEK